MCVHSLGSISALPTQHQMHCRLFALISRWTWSPSEPAALSVSFLCLGPTYSITMGTKMLGQATSFQARLGPQTTSTHRHGNPWPTVQIWVWENCRNPNPTHITCRYPMKFTRCIAPLNPSTVSTPPPILLTEALTIHPRVLHTWSHRGHFSCQTKCLVKWWCTGWPWSPHEFPTEKQTQGAKSSQSQFNLLQDLKVWSTRFWGTHQVQIQIIAPVYLQLIHMSVLPSQGRMTGSYSTRWWSLHLGGAM